MATLKEKKPAILPLKSDLVPVDRTKAACGSILGYTRIEYSAASTNIIGVGTALMEEGGGGPKSYYSSIFTVHGDR